MVLQPALLQGSQLKVYSAMWGPIYEAVYAILGSTGTILPLCDPHHSAPNATTFKTTGGEQITFTWVPSGGWSTWDGHDAVGDDVGFPWRHQGIIPYLLFNGDDEEASTPNNTYWFTDDTNGANVSIGAWVNLTSFDTEQHIFSNWATNQWEFQFVVNTSGIIRYECRDRSTSVNVARRADATLTAGVWTFIVVTYDGSGAGADAMDSVIIYKDGAVFASAVTNNASYVGMEDGTQGPRLGSANTAGNFNGRMAGGPQGLFFTTTVLTADQVLRLYELGRRALAL